MFPVIKYRVPEKLWPETFYRIIITKYGYIFSDKLCEPVSIVYPNPYNWVPSRYVRTAVYTSACTASLNGAHAGGAAAAGGGAPGGPGDHSGAQPPSPDGQ